MRPRCGRDVAEMHPSRQVAWSAPAALGAVKAVARHYGEGASVNDVLLGAALGALGRYVGERNAEIAEDEDAPRARRERAGLARADEMNIGVPFNTRTAAETARVELRNRFALLVPRAARPRRRAARAPCTHGARHAAREGRASAVRDVGGDGGGATRAAAHRRPLAGRRRR